MQSNICIGRLLVKDAARLWLDRYVAAERNEKGQKLAAQRLRDYLNEFLGYKDLDRVTPSDLDSYKVWLLGRGLSLRTVSHVLGDARCFFNWATDSGYMEHSPVRKRLLPGIQEEPPDRLSDEEVETLLSSLSGNLLFVVQFGLATGMRWGEMVRAQISDVNFETGTLLVHRTKNRRLRRVRLPDSFLTLLRKRVGRILPYSLKSSGSIIRDVRRISGVEDFRIKRLRTTYGCRFIENGGSILALSMVLGHRSVTTTEKIYAKLSDEVVKRETEKVHCSADSELASSMASIPIADLVSPNALVAQVDRATVS